MNVTVVGSGVFGLGIALNLNKNGHKVTLLCSSKEKSEKLKNKEITIIDKVNIPETINITSSYEKAIKNADIVFIMTSAKYIAAVCQKISKYYNNKQVFCLGSKGIEQNTHRFVHEVFKKNLKSKNYAILSGPSFAVDLANFEPIAFSLATSNNKSFAIIKNALYSNNVKVRKCSDMIGLELCGAIKNIIAIASGIIGGLGYHESTRSFLIVEAMHDIKNLTKSLNGHKKTILTYGGIGDLMLTCTSEKSRNYSYGYLIGQKDYVKAKEYLKNNTVEGYYTLNSIYALINEKKIEMPVIDLIYQIIMKNENPELLIDFLINKK